MNPYIFLEVWATLKVVVWLYGLTGSYLPLGIIWLPLSNSHCVSLALLLQLKFLALYWASVIKCGQLRFAADKNTLFSTNKARFSMDVLCIPISMLWHVLSSSSFSKTSVMRRLLKFCQRAFWPIKIYVNFVFSSIYVLHVLHILICACSHVLESQKQKQLYHGEWSF